MNSNKTEAPIISIISSQMVEIPGGTIQLRDDRIGGKWTVEIEPFLLGMYPVTQDIYFEVTKQRPGTFRGGNHPVETISWTEAITFCNILSKQAGLNPCYSSKNNSEETIFNPKANGFRLPTEAEWEFACKAGAQGIRYGEIDLIAWYKHNSEQSTHNVGQKLPNAWGLFDMLGNVWEWCSDLYDTEVYGSYRIFRGGGWCDEERSVMATTRRRSHPVNFKIDDLGFRIAKNRE